MIFMKKIMVSVLFIFLQTDVYASYCIGDVCSNDTGVFDSYSNYLNTQRQRETEENALIQEQYERNLRARQQQMREEYQAELIRQQQEKIRLENEQIEIERLRLKYEMQVLEEEKQATTKSKKNHKSKQRSE